MAETDSITTDPLQPCKKCGVPKLPDGFPFRNKTSGDRKTICKQCDNARRKQHSLANSEHEKAYSAAYYKNNPDRFATARKKRVESGKDRGRYARYTEAEKQHHRERSRQWYHSNQARGKETRRQYLKSHRNENRERNKQHRINNPDKIRETNRVYKKTPKARTQQKVYRMANREKIQATYRRIYQERKHLYKATSNRWRLANLEEINARQRQLNKTEAYRSQRRQMWANKPIEQRRAISAQRAHNRRARLRAVEYETIDRPAIIERDNSTCYLCGKVLLPDEITLDHVIPISKGGSHTTNNIKVACLSCNCSKGNRPLEVFMRRLKKSLDPTSR